MEHARAYANRKGWAVDDAQVFKDDGSAKSSRTKRLFVRQIFELCAVAKASRGSRSWELRLITTDLLRSQVCRSTDEVLTTHEQWNAAMREKGWTDHDPT